jgi:hypothetical protein
MAKGNFSQTLSQTLTLTNQTARVFAFERVAEDVVIKEGKRDFVPAGETPNSLAASAVFTQKTVLVKPFSSAAVDVRLTLPAETNIRAVVAMFRGTDKLPTSSGAVGMTASLGALITFNLTSDVKLKPEPVRVIPASETANMKIAQWISNTGTEPVLPEGAAAVLNSNGGLVGKAIFDPQRLLPGERLEFSAEYPGELSPGNYRALCSFQFEGKTQTTEAAFEVPKKCNAAGALSCWRPPAFWRHEDNLRSQSPTRRHCSYPWPGPQRLTRSIPTSLTPPPQTAY